MTHPARLDPLLVALIEKLPDPDAAFTCGDRERWIAAMDAALGLLYPPEWTAEARQRAREALGGPGASGLTAGQARAITETLKPFPEPAHDCSHAFPTMTVPVGGIHLAGPLDKPVLLVPPTDPIIVRGSKEELAKIRSEEASSTTSADAVDDASGGEATAACGAEPAAVTSSPAAAGPDSAPTTPSSGDPARGDKRQPERIKPGTLKSKAVKKKSFNAHERAAILRRVVREGNAHAIAEEVGVLAGTIDRWRREMPRSVERFEAEWAAEQALAEAEPSLAELEAEQSRPVPQRPAVKWPTGPIGRHPIDHERVRRDQADQL